jgi:hypothetical protein
LKPPHRPWYLDPFAWFLTIAAERLEMIGKPEEADYLRHAPFFTNPSLKDFLRRAFEPGEESEFKYSTTAAAAELPGVKQPAEIFDAYPHRVSSSADAVTIVRTKIDLTDEQERQIVAMGNVLVATVIAHLQCVMLLGLMAYAPTKRALKRDMTLGENDHARAVIAVAVTKMGEFFGNQRPRLVAILVAALTKYPITYSETRAVADKLRTFPPGWYLERAQHSLAPSPGA